MTPDQDAAERKRLAETPGLTRQQRALILDSNHAIVIAKALVDALRKSQASAFAKRPESEKAMARAIGSTELVPLGVHMADSVTQTFGGCVEVAKERR